VNRVADVVLGNAPPDVGDLVIGDERCDRQRQVFRFQKSLRQLHADRLSAAKERNQVPN